MSKYQVPDRQAVPWSSDRFAFLSGLSKFDTDIGTALQRFASCHRFNNI